MALIKKHLVWIILGLILIGEGALTFMLMGKSSAAGAKLAELSGAQKKRDDLLKYRDISAAKAEYETQRKYLHDQRQYCVLFFWDRDRAIEALFDAKELEPFGINPWDKAPPNFDVFKDQYQIAYNREVDAIAKKAEEKLKNDRGGLGFASATAFTQPHITLGDIFGAQKEFWIRKALIEIALATEVAELDPIAISRQAGARPGRRVTMVATEDEKKGKLKKPIDVDVVFRCPYPQVSAFIAELYRSPLSFRVKQLDEIVRGESRLRGGSMRRTPSIGPRAMPRGGRTPEEMMEDGAGPEALAPRMDRRGFDEGMAPPPARGVVPAGGEAMAGTVESAAPADSLVEAHMIVEVDDFTLGLAKARFTGEGLDTKAKVRQWLEGKLAGRETARGDLWRATLKALEAAEVKEEGGSVEITFRPEDHFDGSQTFPVTFEERAGTAAYELKMVVFHPAESGDGVAKAVTNLR